MSFLAEKNMYMTQYQGPTQLGNTQMFMQTNICELKPLITAFLY